MTTQKDMMKCKQMVGQIQIQYEHNAYKFRLMADHKELGHQLK